MVFGEPDGWFKMKHCTWLVAFFVLISLTGVSSGWWWFEKVIFAKHFKSLTLNIETGQTDFRAAFNELNASHTEKDDETSETVDVLAGSPIVTEKKRRI